MTAAARGPKGDGAGRLDRTKCAAADPSTELAPVISAAAAGDIFHNSTSFAPLQLEEPLAAAGEPELESGAGVKSMALASKPLKRQADGRLVPDGQGLLNLVSKLRTT